MTSPPRRQLEAARSRLPAVIAILVTTLMAGCGQDTRPAWVDQPGLARPEGLYLTAVGVGAGRDEAADAALARLAQRVAVDVESRETARSTYVADTDDNRMSSRQRVELDRSVDLASGVLLLGSEVVEIWQDPEGSFHALAVLDRTASASAYDELLRGLAEQVRAERTTSDEKSSAWSRYIRLSRALGAAEEHDRLLRIRSVVSPWPGESRMLAMGIATERAALRDELVAVVEPDPGTPAAFEPIVRDALVAAGIAVGTAVAPALRARVSFDTIERPFAQRPDHVVEWQLTVQLVDGETGLSAQGLTVAGDGWGATGSAAAATAIHRARDRLRRELTLYFQELVSPAAVGSAAGDDARSNAR
ncbi:MAG: LPP20 family lipoprotein [Planctomycetota bacterium]|jgi:hypothetical protein